MTTLLTLVTDPRHCQLEEDFVEALADQLRASAVDWLEKGEAVDLLFETEQDAATLEGKVLPLLNDQPVDLIVQTYETRRKALLIADMDSTIIQQECIDELGGAIGIKDQIAEITERAMRGELSFEPAIRERVALLEGLTRAQMEDVLATRIALTDGARTLVQTMKANGAYCALVSGGFTYFTEAIAQKVGFDINRANTLIFAGDKLTGEVGTPILGQDAKRESLHEFIKTHTLEPIQTLAVGDGANDLAMIRDAGLGVAFHAKPAVAAEANARINHTTLTTLLFAQGYSRKDFVA